MKVYLRYGSVHGCEGMEFEIHDFNTIRQAHDYAYQCAVDDWWSYEPTTVDDIMEDDDTLTVADAIEIQEECVQNEVEYQVFTKDMVLNNIKSCSSGKTLYDETYWVTILNDIENVEGEKC